MSFIRSLLLELIAGAIRERCPARRRCVHPVCCLSCWFAFDLSDEAWS
jgi:hypothetical protein